jgi:gluconokinase
MQFDRVVQGAREGWEAPPAGIVAIGVSGSGKSTLGSCFAAKLDCAFLEGDDFHDAASVAKMRAGTPLDDVDRWPWLDRLGAAIGTAARTDGIVAASCSALKRVYRERLAEAAGVPLLFVLLDADRETLQRRLLARPGHYMPASLLDSQFAALERPGSDEPAATFASVFPPDDVCVAALAWARGQIVARD